MTSTSRPLLFTIFHRKRVHGRPRHYARISTALPSAIRWLLLQGEPGDLVELAHASSGTQLATIRIHVGGRFTIQLNQE